MPDEGSTITVWANPAQPWDMWVRFGIDPATLQWDGWNGWEGWEDFYAMDWMIRRAWPDYERAELIRAELMEGTPIYVLTFVVG